MIGQKWILLHEVDSTNNYAANLLSEGKLASGTVILADKQTAGRGQRGNSWSSAAGNQLAYTVYAETAFLSAERYWYLNLAVALAVRQTALMYVPEEQVCVKWPNDILVNNRKIGGILIETQWRTGRIQGAIIGIGMNIHTEQGLPSAGALRDFTDAQITQVDLARQLTAQLNLQFERLQKGLWNHVYSDYHEVLWMKEVPTVATLPDGSSITGKITGIDQSGNLLFESEGTIQSYGLKEIVFSY